MLAAGVVGYVECRRGARVVLPGRRVLIHVPLVFRDRAVVVEAHAGVPGDVQRYLALRWIALYLGDGRQVAAGIADRHLGQCGGGVTVVIRHAHPLVLGPGAVVGDLQRRVGCRVVLPGGLVAVHVPLAFDDFAVRVPAGGGVVVDYLGHLAQLDVARQDRQRRHRAPAAVIQAGTHGHALRPFRVVDRVVGHHVVFVPARRCAQLIVEEAVLHRATRIGGAAPRREARRPRHGVCERRIVRIGQPAKLGLAGPQAVDAVAVEALRPVLADRGDVADADQAVGVAVDARQPPVVGPAARQRRIARSRPAVVQRVADGPVGDAEAVVRVLITDALLVALAQRRQVADAHQPVLVVVADHALRPRQLHPGGRIGPRAIGVDHVGGGIEGEAGGAAGCGRRRLVRVLAQALQFGGQQRLQLSHVRRNAGFRSARGLLVAAAAAGQQHAD